MYITWQQKDRNTWILNAQSTDREKALKQFAGCVKSVGVNKCKFTEEIKVVTDVHARLKAEQQPDKAFWPQDISVALLNHPFGQGLPAGRLLRRRGDTRDGPGGIWHVVNAQPPGDRLYPFTHNGDWRNDIPIYGVLREAYFPPMTHLRLDCYGIEPQKEKPGPGEGEYKKQEIATRCESPHLWSLPSSQEYMLRTKSWDGSCTKAPKGQQLVLMQNGNWCVYSGPIPNGEIERPVDDEGCLTVLVYKSKTP